MVGPKLFASPARSRCLDRRAMGLVPVVIVTVLVTAACVGDSTRVSTDGSGANPDAPDPTDRRHYTASATVLESPRHGPQLCLAGVQESLPPQCSGPDIIGWDWDAVEGEDSANGTTWGTYTVVGTWDGKALTLTEPPRSPAPPEQDAGFELSTPCPEPEGGWQVVDSSTATEESMQAAIEYARSQPTVGGAWVDQSLNPARDEPANESSANDPTMLILNVAFTDDLERHEEAIREIWGGALCVSQARMSAAELAGIRAELEADVSNILFSALDEVRGQVQIGVPVDDGLQQRLDERYGPDVVEVQAQLRPVGT